MPSLPSLVLDWLAQLSPVFQAFSWQNFLFLMAGLLYGRAAGSVVRAAEYAPSDYNWRRLHAFLRQARWDGAALVEALIHQTLQTLFPQGWPQRLWWVVDVTEREKASAKKIPGISKVHRGARQRGQSRCLWGHRYLVLGLLYPAQRRWQALITHVALVWGRRSFEQQLARFLGCLRAVAQGLQTLVADRAFGSTRFLRLVRHLGYEGVVRLKRNFVVHAHPSPARRTGQRGRPALYGPAYRVEHLPLRRMQKTRQRRWIRDRLYWVTIWRGTFLRQGVGPLEILALRWGRQGRMWLAATDPTLTTDEILEGYNGRWAVEPAIHECKDLGLGQYRGRRMAGVRRHPLLIAVTHTVLSLIALGALPVELPELGWDWYPCETTVGQVQRHLIKWLQAFGAFQPTSKRDHRRRNSSGPRQIKWAAA